MYKWHEHFKSQEPTGTEYNEIGRSKLIKSEMIIKVKDCLLHQLKEPIRGRLFKFTDDLMKATLTFNRGYLRTGITMCWVNVTGSVSSSGGSTLRRAL